MKISLEEAKELSKDILIAIEMEYKCEIARLAYFKRKGESEFQIGVIFADYRILDADIRFVEDFDMKRIYISGSVV